MSWEGEQDSKTIPSLIELFKNMQDNGILELTGASCFERLLF
jgi:hypothetical protein